MKLLLRSFVEVGAELRERGKRAVLGQLQAQRAGDRLHRLDLRVAADAADRDADIDRRPHVGVEQVGLQVDLAVGDRDHVGRDISRNVARLRLDERQRGQRPAAEGVVQLGGALQQARVQIENVARKRLAPRRTAQEQGNFAVRRGVFRQVVEDAQRVAARIAEVFADRRARKRRQELHRRRVGRRRGDHDRVLHRAVVFEHFNHLRHRRALLADGDIDADHVAAFLVEDRVDRDGGLARLPVADNQLALPAADRNHRIDGLQTGLHRLADRPAGDDAGRDALDRVVLRRLDRTFAIDGPAQGIDHAADHRLADRNGNDPARALDLVAFLQVGSIAEQHRADLVFLQVHRNARHAAGKSQQLAGHDFLQTVQAGDAVAERNDPADLGDLDGAFVVLDLVSNQFRDFTGADLCHRNCPL